jgi:hypothetical protein
LTLRGAVGMASAMTTTAGSRNMKALRNGSLVLFLALTMASALATATKKDRTQVELNVKPVSAQLFIDGKAMGKATAGRVIDVTPGFHVIRLVHKRDEHEERIKFPPNQKTTYTFEFEEEAPAPDVAPTPVPDDESMRRQRSNTDNPTPPAKTPEPASP